MSKKKTSNKFSKDDCPLVKVEWADHFIDYGDHDIEDVLEIVKDAYIGSYAGYLVAKSQRMIAIAPNIWEDGTISDPMYIMRRAILGYKEYPPEVTREDVIKTLGQEDE